MPTLPPPPSVPEVSPAISPDAQLERRMQERLFWFSAALGAATGLFYGSWFLVYGPSALVWAQGAVVVITLFFSVLVWRTRDPRRGIAGLVPCLAAILTLMMWLQGGLQAPTIWWLVVLPFAWMLAGSIEAGLALGVVLLVVMIFTPAAIEYFGLPNLSAQSKAPQKQYIASMAGAMVVYGVFVAFSLKLRRDLRTELLRTMQELEASRDEALSASTVKARFLANMSHEIHTPINGILGAIELLRSTALDARQQQIVALQRQSLDNLMALVTDVLDYTRLESGRLQLDPAPVELRDIAFDALELHAANAHGGGLELTCSMAPEVPRMVMADPVRLRQILGNLVSNAVKFTARGGVHVHIEEAPGPAPQGCVNLRLEVQDTGVGIEPERLQGLFSAFARGANAVGRNSSGTGLGLAICRELARLMGGDLGCSSVPGQGSTFTLALTLERCVHTPDATPPLDVPLHVLIVANYLPLVQHVQAQLRELGVTYEVKAVPSTQAELQDARERGVNAVLLDERLLGAHGRDRLEQMAREVGMPVLLLCGISSDSTLGALDGVFVLYKPVRSRALRDGLRWSLQSRRQAALAAASTRPSRPSPAERAPGLAGRVLLVDDNPVNQVMTQAMLERLGLTVVVAGDGQEALMRFGEQTFDVVLMDVQMPGMDGLMATERLRAVERMQSRGRTPVLAVTGNPEPEIRARGHSVGMDDFLGKPFTLEQLEQMLVRWQPRLMPGNEVGAPA